MEFVNFKIIKDGKDTGRLAGIICNKTISVDLLADLLVSYPESAGYELALNEILDQEIEENDNGKH